MRFGQETFSNSPVRCILAVTWVCKHLTRKRKDSSFGAEERSLMSCEIGLAGFFEEPISPSYWILFSTHFSAIYRGSIDLLGRRDPGFRGEQKLYRRTPRNEGKCQLLQLQQYPRSPRVFRLESISSTKRLTPEDHRLKLYTVMSSEYRSGVQSGTTRRDGAQLLGKAL